MTALDLTEAVEAAARAIWEDSPPPTRVTWKTVTTDRPGLAHSVREVALAAVTAAASHTETDRLRTLLADTAVAWRRAERAAHDIDEPGLWWDLLGQVRDIADRLDAHTRPRGEKR